MTLLLERLFKLTEQGSNFKNECVAGLTTFAAMSHILVFYLRVVCL